MRLCGLSDIVKAATGTRLYMPPCVSDGGDMEYTQNCDTYPPWEIRTVQSEETDHKHEDGPYDKTGSGLN